MALTALVLLAFFPVWHWYGMRCFDGSDEPICLLALGSLLMTRLFFRSASSTASGEHESKRQASSFAVVITCIGLYCVTFPWAPRLLQSVFAAVALGALLNCCRGGINIGEQFLLLLSVPVSASLNFFAGFPLRLLATKGACLMLGMSSLAVQASGTTMLWNGHVISVDPPCSGIKMLWMAAYLAAMLATLLQINTRRSLLLLAFAMTSAIIANVMRVASLFLLEAGLLPVHEQMHHMLHEGIGLATFAAAGAANVAFAYWLARLADDRNHERQVAQTEYRTSSPIALPSITSNETGPLRTKSVPLLATVSAVAIALPLLPLRASAVNPSLQSSTLTQNAGVPSDAVSITSPYLTKEFRAGFPGTIEIYSNKRETYIVRQVRAATRQLHSSSDCYQGLGYTVTWVGTIKDDDSHDWAQFQAIKGAELLTVNERIFDGAGHNYTDVSQWYWASMLQTAKAPFCAVTVVRNYPE